MSMFLKNILVTGSSGTIGTRLCERLFESGYRVFGVDRKRNVWNSEIDALTSIGDLRLKRSLTSLPTNIDLIIHLAANARVYNLVKDPSLARDNFEILFNVLEFARVNKIPRFMFASSREVYGNSKKIIHGEQEVAVEDCESPYTASKLGGEALVHSYRQCYGIDSVIIRFSNVYGRYDGSDRLIPLYLSRAREGKDLLVYGRDKLLDFTYIDDAVDGVLKAMKRFSKAKNNTFNLAYGKGESIFKVAHIVKKLLHSKSKIVIRKNRIGEVVKYIADISKARKYLGYRPKINIVLGIKKTIEWYEQNFHFGQH